MCTCPVFFFNPFAVAEPEKGTSQDRRTREHIWHTDYIMHWCDIIVILAEDMLQPNTHIENDGCRSMNPEFLNDHPEYPLPLSRREAGKKDHQCKDQKGPCKK